MDINVTNVFERNFDALKDPNYRFVVNIGGSRSSKTYSLSQLVIIYCMTNPNKIVSVVRKTLPSLKATVMRDIIEILRDMGLYSDKNHNKTENIYKFPNGSILEFFSIDDEQKIRGRKRDLLWLNEANEINFEEFNQLNFRTTEKLFFDFNPSDLYHWLYDLLFRGDSIKIHSTYKDNPFLSPSIVKEIENLINVDYEYYKIYCLGEVATSKSTIFNHQKEYTEDPEGGEISYGVDFGYTHPTAIVKVRKIENKLYVEELLYQSFLTSGDLIILMNDMNMNKNTPLLCDYSRPEMISDLRRAGYNAMNANKNVKEGIDFIKSNELYIKNTSTNLWKEIRQYKWKTKGETILDEPVKVNDDACFIGDTLITTDKGDIPIRDIKVGDMVLTSNGYKKVLIKHNNGERLVRKYGIQTDTDYIYICSTHNHLIKTTKEWKEISQLKSGMMVYQYRHLTEEPINCIQEEDTLCNINTICTTKYGNSSMVKEKRGIIYTTLMEILGTIESKIFKRLILSHIYHNIVKKCLWKTLIYLKNFTKQVLKLQKNGIKVKKVESGINNTEKIVGLIENIKQKYVKYVVKNIKQDTQVYQNSVITIVKLNHLEQGEEWKETVYDLTIEDNHEYFANGILVHNCDAIRYASMYFKNKGGGLSTSFSTFSF